MDRPLTEFYLLAIRSFSSFENAIWLGIANFQKGFPTANHPLPYPLYLPATSGYFCGSLLLKRW
jgi:hypothetical protein